MVSLFLTYPSFSCFTTCCVWSEVDFLFTDDVVATECDLLHTFTILFSCNTLQGVCAVYCHLLGKILFLHCRVNGESIQVHKTIFHCYDLICPHLLHYLYTRTIWKGSSWSSKEHCAWHAKVQWNPA